MPGNLLYLALAGGFLPDRSAIRQVRLRRNPGLARPAFPLENWGGDVV